MMNGGTDYEVNYEKKNSIKLHRTQTTEE